MWSRDIKSGLCKSCWQAHNEAAAADEAQRLKEWQEQSEQEREFIVVDGKTFHCPVCGHDRFTKRKMLLNVAGESSPVVSLDWRCAHAETSTCQRCGYMLWFWRESE